MKKLTLNLLIAILLLPSTCKAEYLNISYPVDANYISSKFGLRKHPVHKVTKHHFGVDLPAPKGATIHAVAPGRIVFAGEFQGYGKLIVISHTKELTTHYGHCDSISVSVGEIVNAGQIIGEVGESGISTGSHLHFEVRKEGVPLNPESVLPALGSKAEG